MGFVANFIRFPALQKVWKSVKTWHSYKELKCGNFVETQCIYSHDALIAVSSSGFWCRAAGWFNETSSLCRRCVFFSRRWIRCNQVCMLLKYWRSVVSRLWWWRERFSLWRKLWIAVMRWRTPARCSWWKCWHRSSSILQHPRPVRWTLLLPYRMHILGQLNYCNL